MDKPLKNKNYILGIIFSIFVIGYIFLKLDWSAVRQIFSTLNWLWICLGFIVYLTNYLLRTFRFKILLQLENFSFSQLMGAICLYGMYLYILPAKSGEISYPVILKRSFNISLPESTATLVTARFFDFATISLFIPVVLFVYREKLPTWFLYSGLSFCGCVILFGIIAIWLIRRRNPFIIAKFKTSKNRWTNALVNLFENFLYHLRTIDQRRQYWRLWLITIGIWLFVYTNFYLIVLGLGYHFSYFQMIVVSILMIPMTLLPFQGFANLGTHEIGWVAAFSILGHNSNEALVIAVGSHTIMLLFVLMLGVLGFLLLKSHSFLSKPDVR